MSRTSRLRQAARALVIATPALIPLSASHAAPSRVSLSGHLPAALASAKVTGQVAAKTPITLAISLPLRNSAELSKTIQRLYDPKDALYGHYLSPAQFAAKYGPTPADYQAVIAYAQSKGLIVTKTFTARTVVDVKGSASAVQGAFGVHLNNYVGKNGAAFFAADTEPSLPQSLAGKVSGILGLSNAAHLKPQHIILTPQQRTAALARRAQAQAKGGPQFGFGHGHFGAYTPTDLRVGYGLKGLPFDGKGQTLGIFALGGFLKSDIDTYRKFYHLPNIPVTVVPVDGYSGAINDPGIAVEADLDIDMQTALAPGAKEIRVYEAPPPYPQGLVDALAVMADENKAQQISISYGIDEASAGVPVLRAEYASFAQLAVQGQSAFASAGDNGAYSNGFSVSQLDPSSQPLVTSVGGTELYEFPDSSYYGEVTWNGLGIGDGATGGGVSISHKIPFYQKGTTGLASTTYRNVPDISAVADPITGVDVYSSLFDDGQGGFIATFAPVGGTSASAPIWAGFMARVNQARVGAGLPSLGFANPAIYSIGNSFLSFFDMHDVYDGTNGNASIYGDPGYAAGIGYDNATGFGSLVGGQLIEDLAAAPTTNTALPGAINGFGGTPGSHSVVLTWAPSTGAKGYLLYTITSGTLNLVGATTSNSLKVGGLQTGTTYEFYMGAVNTGGATYVTTPIYVTTNPQ